MIRAGDPELDERVAKRGQETARVLELSFRCRVENSQHDSALTCATGELEFRESVLTTAKEAVARGTLPSDAVSYCEARLRADRAASNAARQPPTHPEVRDEVQQLLAKDQAVRQGTNFDLARMQQVDRENEAAVTAILDRYGVPTIAMVGREAASGFVTLVLHQPPALRLRVLPQLSAALDVGQADPKGYATLYDRAQRDAGRAQSYGQNLECSSENPRLHRAPIEDEAHVNLRRAGVGLVRLEMYERIVIESSQALCGAQVK